MVLAGCLVDSTALSRLPQYLVAERYTADRVALLATGDLRAGLVALCPPDATTPETRAAALTSAPALIELCAFARALA